MDVVIENFYNTINFTMDEQFSNDFFDNNYLREEECNYNKTEILEKCLERGLSIKELSILTNESEEDIKSILNT